MEINSTDKNIKNLQLLYTKAYEITLDATLMLRMAIQRELDSGLYVRGDSVDIDNISDMSLDALALVINNLKFKVESNSAITITKKSPRWNKDECKRYFVEAMTPFIEAIEKCHKETGNRGEIDFRQCTINNDDYSSVKLCSKDLDEIFDVIWEEYFLNGYAEFNDDSEFSWDMYYNAPDNSGATFADCMFYYKDCKLYLAWNSMYEPYMPEYLNYYRD